MIQVDINELQRLTDILIRTASVTDDTLSRLRAMRTQMTEDIELAAYPQTPVVLEDLNAAITQLERGNDALISLKNIVALSTDTYVEKEREYREAVERISSVMESLALSVGADMSASGAIIPQDNLEGRAAFEAAELVEGNVASMEMTNVAAIGSAIREEYGALEIESE